MRWAITTHPGLAPVTAEEVRTLGLEAEVAGPAWVSCNAPAGGADLLGLRSAHDLLRAASFARGEDPIEVAVTLAEHFELNELGEAKSFRVTCQRHGHHDFGSAKVAGAVGAVIQRRSRLAVSLDRPDVVVRADVHDQGVTLGVLHNARRLSLRHPRIYHQRVTASCNVAFGLSWLTRGQCEAKSILDPFCGSGTLLMEAAAVYPEAHLFGSDWQEAAALGTAANLHALGLNVSTECADALVSEGEPVDLIVANPPHGIRLGKRLSFLEFSKRFIRNAGRRLRPKGVLAVLVIRQRGFISAVESVGGFEPGPSLAINLGAHVVHAMTFKRV